MGSAPSSSSSPHSLPSLSMSKSSSSPPQSPTPAESPTPPHSPTSPQLPTKIHSQSISSYNEEQLASYDIPNAKECKSQMNDMEILHQFNQFVESYGMYYNNRANQNKTNLNFKKSDISVLVIIGSSIVCTRSKFFNGIYQKNAEDLSTAIFIRHIFHNAFGIPYNQILITSTQESDFYVDDVKIELISRPNTFFKVINDSVLTFDTKDGNKNIDFHFININEVEFMLHQKINLVQIGDQQYKFLMSEKLADIIKPFNIRIIRNELKTFSNSNVLVFFLDHGYTGGFSDNIPYQFFIERLLEIECKHFYVFNDSCGSGSMIKLIELSHKFKDIFPNIDDETLESALFYFFTNLNKVNPNDVKDAINSKLDKIDKYELSDKIKNDMKNILVNINEKIAQKISDFVINMDIEFNSVGCVPKLFLQFSEKATIFTSSLFNKKSLTLPGRKIDISILNESRIRVFGSIFSSIFIESLLDTEGQLSFKSFCECIRRKYISYSQNFKNIILSQNEYINEKSEINLLPNKNEIELFFSMNPCSNDLIYLNNDDWPDFSSKMLEKKYWNVDQSNVETNEYKNVHFCMFIMKNYS